MFILIPTKLISFFKRVLPFLSIKCLACFFIGISYSLFLSPEDYKQGEVVRIMYLHVPSAWLSLGIYSLIAFFSFISLVWNNACASILARAAAPTGIVFSAVCLITGSIWGKGTWGAWWVWDARLTTMLILFFLYSGYILLWSFFDNKARAEKSSALFAIFSAINIPIVKFSVDLWATLHQPASILRRGGIAIESSILLPLIIMLLFFTIFFLITWILNFFYFINSYRIKREISMRY
ncbi:heme ABC transporter permease CcmC [Wolbachia endosymbiont of Pentidionis agamae]|uniref:heme ABC transporter permease CcmC n=1 Tax=Wolbachia endosymbiont of Pentidionis agamae TaxID=3110435 RepID=UPI002FD689CA